MGIHKGEAPVLESGVDLGDALLFFTGTVVEVAVPSEVVVLLVFAEQGSDLRKNGLVRSVVSVSHYVRQDLLGGGAGGELELVALICLPYPVILSSVDGTAVLHVSIDSRDDNDVEGRDLFLIRLIGHEVRPLGQDLLGGAALLGELYQLHVLVRRDGAELLDHAGVDGGAVAEEADGEGVLVGLLNGSGVEEAGDHGGRLGAGDRRVGIKLAVLSAVDYAGAVHCVDRLSGEFRDAVRVGGSALTGGGKRQLLSGLESVQHGGELGAGDLPVRVELRRGPAVHYAVLLRPGDCLGVVLAVLYVGEGAAGFDVGLVGGAIQDRSAHAAGQRAVRVELC